MTETVQGLLRDYDRSVRPGYPGYPGGGGGGLTVGVTVYVLAIPELNEETMVKSSLSLTCTANHLAIANRETK